MAVSRAIKEIIVIKSISYPDFGHDIGSLKPGAKVFADYIKYVDELQHHSLDDVAFNTIGANYTYDKNAINEYQAEPSPLETEIYQELKLNIDETKYKIIPQVKQSGFYIDLAIKDLQTDRFVLAVECDGYTYHSSPEQRARDIGRQSILETAGGKFVRVSSIEGGRGSKQVAIEKILNKLANNM